MENSETSIFTSQIVYKSPEEPALLSIPKCVSNRAFESGQGLTGSFVVITDFRFPVPGENLVLPCYVIPVSSEVAAAAYHLSSTKSLEDTFQGIIMNSEPNLE